MASEPLLDERINKENMKIQIIVGTIFILLNALSNTSTLLWAWLLVPSVSISVFLILAWINGFINKIDVLSIFYCNAIVIGFPLLLILLGA